MTHSTLAPPTAEQLALVARAFAPKLLEGDLLELLAYLNGLTDHRFTGVYRFEPGWVVSVALWDRENPHVRIGADVKMKESYCWLTGLEGERYVIEDAWADPRLNAHPARESVRSYVGALLLDARRRPWGTLCHFDFTPRAATPEMTVQLEFFRPLIEELFVRDVAAQWDPSSPSGQRCFRRSDTRAN